MVLPPNYRSERLLESARAGDEGAFSLLIEPHLPQLHAHCRRILGSPHDADDALQDALLRAWRGFARFDGRGALRPWLFRIATNTCLDALRRRRSEPEPRHEPEKILTPEVGLSPADRLERRESLELAVAATLRHLPPRQRGALILSDALGLSAREAAGVMETTPTSVHSALQRARRRVDERMPDPSGQATARAQHDTDLSAEVDRYIDAMERADIGGIATLLREERADAASGRRRRARARRAADRSSGPVAPAARRSTPDRSAPSAAAA